MPTGLCLIAVHSLRTDSDLPPPAVSLRQEGCVEMGTNVTLCVETRTNVTIQCRNKDKGTSFLLHKDGCSAPVQRQDPDGAGTASFTLLAVTLADSGTYRCSSRSRNFPFVSSPLGDSVTLEVTPTPTPPGRFKPPYFVAPAVTHGWQCHLIHPCAGDAGDEHSQIPAPPRAELVSHGNLVVAVLRGCAAALIFSLGIFFVIDARRLWIQRDVRPGGESLQWF